jgi:hypothetical protein
MNYPVIVSAWALARLGSTQQSTAAYPRGWTWGGCVGLAYSDAVRLLGGTGSRAVTALDRLTGGLLLAATAAGSGFALSLFEARAELVRLSGELVTGLSERLRGLDRFGRSERLAAAHAVIVVVAYFDALSGADLPFDARDLELTGSEQAFITTGAQASSGLTATVCRSTGSTRQSSY